MPATQDDVIAELRHERDAALAREAAVAEVLDVINRSPGDPQPVFATILAKAHMLCGAAVGTLHTYDGAHFRAMASRGGTQEWAAVIREPRDPGPNDRKLVSGARFVHIADLQALEASPEDDTSLRLTKRNPGWRTLLMVPLRKDDTLLGYIGSVRLEARPFSDKEIALLENFAAQAVIAMENARLLSEQREALERQTAVAEVLAVINANPGNLPPVFDAMLEKAMRLCGAAFGLLRAYDGAALRALATRGLPPAYAEFAAQRQTDIMPDGAVAQALVGGRPTQRMDVREFSGYRDGNPAVRALADLGGARTSLHVPLVKNGASVGLFTVYRQEVHAFTARQIALLENFAAQAVIAMENARLLTEQREALERQTATAEILAVINANPGDLAPVFDAMLERAMRLCGAAFGMLRGFDGQNVGTLATFGVPAAYAEYTAGHAWTPMPAGPLAEALASRRTVQLLDVREMPGYRDHPAALALAELGGARTILFVPLVKDGVSIGVFAIYRQEVRSFGEKEIALLENFAAQAVIAMENARLLTEQREALERQTATAEVLQAINAHPGNLEPVFDVMLEKALRLCGAAFGMLHTYDGQRFSLVASRGVSEALVAHWRRTTMPTAPDSPPGQVIATRRPVQVVDVLTHPFFVAHPDVSVPQMDIGGGGRRAVLNVPLLKDNAVVGLFVIYRLEPGAWPDKQVSLLEGFAAQAVIAMENARLLTEQREALERQTATAEVLQVINASPGNLAPVFDAMLDRAMRLCGINFGLLRSYDGESIGMLSSRGVPAPFAEFLKTARYASPRPQRHMGEALASGRPRQVLDMSEDPLYRNGAADNIIAENIRAIVDLGGARTVLHVPLVKDGASAGFFTFFRQEVRAFTDKEIALLESFAAQAVIAMENARLLTEQREALERQTATAEILAVINASPGDLAPVFDKIVEEALRVCGAGFGILNICRGTEIVPAASRGVAEAYRIWRAGYSDTALPGGPSDRLMATKRAVHVLDIRDEPNFAVDPVLRAVADLAGSRTVVMVPLLKDQTVIGMINVFRQEVRAFADKEIAILESFAAQAVIAMENARLLGELQARDEDNRRLIARQSASIEILRTISENPDDPQPVFDMIARRARELCGAEAASVSELDGNLHHMRVMIGHDAEAVARLMANFPRALEKTTVHGATILAGDVVQVRDIAADPVFGVIATLQLGNAGSAVGVPLRSDGRVIGAIGLSRSERGGFDDEAVDLVESFAEQAVIAISSAKAQRALRARTEELSARQEELRVTFENMGDGVALFDETQHLAAWNRKFQDLIEVPDEVIGRRQTFVDYVRYLAERGEYGRGADVEGQVRRLLEQSGQSRSYERTRPNGRVIQIHHNPVPSGGFVLIYSDITERKRAEAEIAAARDAAEQAARTIEAAYRDLKVAQANLIQAEKMASLGQLTAGIAHEIKNPLNFVNNFSDLSVELLEELHEAIGPALAGLGEGVREDVEDITATLTSNLKKITEHGRRADGIVRSMLEHSRGSSGERRVVDLNAEVEEALNLAYHGARAQNQSFNISLERDYADAIAPIELTPQDITRVFLNLINNGFYAATKRAQAEQGFAPALKVSTRDLGDRVEIRVRDNGTGVPLEIREKLFQPFFTTKPTGEGTGLGLSISYDVVTKQHGGSIAVDSEPGAFTEFTVTLPRTDARAVP